MEKETRIEAFSAKDEKDVLRLLSDAHLPTEDLTCDKLDDFLVARNSDGSIIGAVGVEQYEDAGLLRSLVVNSSYRGRGLGKELTSRLESSARRKGIKSLFLLTVTAPAFFPKAGYEVIRRDTVPEAIGRTEEFKNICPVSAACLRKTL